MDDSDQDFVDLCSKLLKRVRRKPGEPRQTKKREQQPSCPVSKEEKRTRNNKNDCESESKPVGSRTEVDVMSERPEHSSEDAGSSIVPPEAVGLRPERGLTAKDKVLHRMQQFKRASPQRMVRTDKSQTTNNCVPLSHTQIQESPESSTLGFHLESQGSDEALAMRLQEELNREAAETHTLYLEDGGLFFCQICHKDLSHMTPEGRTQHLNRCLDKSEESAPTPLPPAVVSECPICGKKFKSQKSRAAHLKRCSSEMGISPAVLLQALQRQAEEAENVSIANTLAQTGGSKRKGATKPGLPPRKKHRKKAELLDEDTMVALALSSSLLEKEKEQQREGEAEIQLQAEIAVRHTSLKLMTDQGKSCGKKKKGTISRPPPLLLVQDAQEAQMRLQERVSSLLHSWPHSPPTPTRCPSNLRGWTGTAPLWQKSTLLDCSTCLSDFYTPELRQLITPWESAKTDAASSNTSNKPDSSLQDTAVTDIRASLLPSSSQTASGSSAASTPGTRQLPVGSQALRDLMELAEDGVTLTQCGYSASEHNKDLQLSGFFVEEADEPAVLCVSSSLPETTHGQVRRRTDQSGTDKEHDIHQSVALSRLATDLSSMVNNSQLSDVQLQVDCGDVYFAHSFMVYARCPLLAEMVYESGFRVQEEGMPAAQRVLISDVPGQAVFALLQYLYTSHCSIPASLQHHVLELAFRFDLQELQQLCELHQDTADCTGQVGDVNNQTDWAFMTLLRSMWNEQGYREEEMDTDGGKDGERALEDQRGDELTSGDKDISEEKINEEELDEIYKFAATQKNRRERNDSEEEEEGEEDVCTSLAKSGLSEKNPKFKSHVEADPSLEGSYSRLFSESWGEYKQREPPSLSSTSGLLKTHPPQSQHRPFHKLSSKLSGRTLLQSSASIVDDFSQGSVPSTSNLPVPGMAPGQVDDCGSCGEKKTDANKLDGYLTFKQESQGPHSICVPFPTALPQKKKMEPDVIVLSDSSEEMDVVLSPSSHSPGRDTNTQTYTQIKCQQIPKLNKPTFDKEESINLKSSSGDPVDCSPEVSWLIPSTPAQPRSSIRDSTSQTKSSVCRARLFPEDNSSPRPCVSSSPASSESPLQTSNSPVRLSTHVSPAEVSVSRMKQNKISSVCNLDLTFSPKRTSRYNVSKDRGLFTVPPAQPNISHHSSLTHFPSLQTSSKQDPPSLLQAQPYSSTPLHKDLHRLPGHFAASSLQAVLYKNTAEARNRTTSESPEKSFHFSPLSNPLDQLSQIPSSHISLQSSQKQIQIFSENQHIVESSSHTNTHMELKNRVVAEAIGVKNETGEDKKDTGDQQEEAKGESGELDCTEYRFHPSFMDEPPIAFNDSWGLDACIEENPGCFSLRLEDSGGSSHQDRSLGQGTRSPSNIEPPASRCSIQSSKNCIMVDSSPFKQPPTSMQTYRGPSFTSSLPDPTTRTSHINSSLLDSKIWDSWEEEEEAVPLSQRVNPSAHLKTPTSSLNKKRRSLVPVTPLPHYSDMDTPELKSKLSRFGVRPLPKRQMILKLKEIHQYTHQLVSSDSEEEASSVCHSAQTRPHTSSSAAAGNKLLSCTQTVKFKEPSTLAAISPVKHNKDTEEEELPSASQGSNTSSAAASEESERSNPELCLTSDSESDIDGGISASQAANCLQDRLQAVHSFIMSDSALYSQILHYQPLVLSQFQERLKAAGIRLGAAKLVDYLDSQCITFTTAKPGQSALGHRRGRRTGKREKAGGKSRARQKKGVTAVI